MKKKKEKYFSEIGPFEQKSIFFQKNRRFLRFDKKTLFFEGIS